MIEDTSFQDSVVESSPLWRKKLLMFALALAVVIAISGYCYWRGNPVMLSQLTTATVTSGDLEEQLKLQGKIVTLNSPPIYSPANGFVTFNVAAGETVTKGQLLAQVVNNELLSKLEEQQSQLKNLTFGNERQAIVNQRQIDQAKQALSMAQLEFESAANDYRRAKLSLTKGIMSQVDFEQAEFAEHIAQVKQSSAQHDLQLLQQSVALESSIAAQQLDQQQRMVQLAQLKVDQLNILAPSDGVIGDILVDSATYLEKVTALMTLINANDLAISIEVPESYSQLLEHTKGVSVSTFDSELPAQLVSVSPEVKNNKVTVLAKFTALPKTVIKKNQSVAVTLTFETLADVLKLHKGPLLSGQDTQYLYVVKGDTLVRTRVHLGKESRSEIQVEAGLKPGDNVVIAGLEQSVTRPTVSLDI